MNNFTIINDLKQGCIELEKYAVEQKWNYQMVPTKSGWTSFKLGNYCICGIQQVHPEGLFVKLSKKEAEMISVPMIRYKGNYAYYGIEFRKTKITDFASLLNKAYELACEKKNNPRKKLVYCQMRKLEDWYNLNREGLQGVSQKEIALRATEVMGFLVKPSNLRLIRTQLGIPTCRESKSQEGLSRGDMKRIDMNFEKLVSILVPLLNHDSQLSTPELTGMLDNLNSILVRPKRKQKVKIEI